MPFAKPTYYSTFNNPRWCARCGTRCKNSGLTPAEADRAAAKEYQALIEA